MASDNNVAEEDVLAYNEKILVHSRWELEGEENVVKVERVSTHGEGDVNDRASDQQVGFE